METHKPDEARKRGRPRSNIESQQRRRKQLRIAQQAYRTRKANTISTLEKRVHELECDIEELSQSFLAFSNLLVGTDLLGKHPPITLALQKITQQYVSLAKTGCANPDEGTLNEAASIPPASVDQGENSSDSHSVVTSDGSTPTGLSSTSTQWPELLFWNGPAFRGQTVEAALRLARKS
ncbi:hypothetical protein N7465_011052 [Penicillium sp. CMV-2018d]|nr:hypothetical protein N7465_011052 [Penicillium sp. CMV-2018d]